MNLRSKLRRSIVADSLFGVLNPIPFGCFVAALIFDIIYASNAVVLWGKSAAWLIVFGLMFAIVPRLINVVRVWITARLAATRADRLDFWLNLLAIVAAVLNAFVHSRDAYAVVPASVLLSVCTVLLLSIGRIIVAVDPVAPGAYAHE